MDSDGTYLRFHTCQVVLAAVSESGLALEHASCDLRCSNVAFFLAGGKSLWETSPEPFVGVGSSGDDHNLVSTAVSECGAALRFASARLRGAEDVVRRALRSDEMVLCWASQELESWPTTPLIFTNVSHAFYRTIVYRV